MQVSVITKKKLKDIIDADMVSTIEGVTDNSPNALMASTPVNKPSSRKSLCIFTNILNGSPKTAKRRFVAAKSKHKATEVGNSLWNTKKNRKGHSKINMHINYV